MEQVLSRRLVAVLCADVAGYSALVGEDESGTVAALKGHQIAVLELLQLSLIHISEPTRPY